MRTQKGITLIALLITIVVLIIIASVSISTGISAVNKTKLKGFYMQLEIIQKRVDDIATTNESYIDKNGNTIYIKLQGIEVINNEELRNKLVEIIEYEGGDLTKVDLSGFRYFTSNELKDILGLSNIDYNVFIDFENRIVISEQGIRIDGRTYHMLESSTYFVKKGEPDKNVGNIDFTIEAVKYGSKKYKITVIPSPNIGDLNGTGTVKYKEIFTNYWETSTSLEIIANELPKYYDIIYRDINNNISVQKTYGIKLDDKGDIYITRIIKIYTPAQLLSINPSEIAEDETILLMKNIDFKPSDYGTQYWTPIGEIESLKGKFDGNDCFINVTYTDDENDEYTITYDKTNNYSEPEYTFNIIPKFEDGKIATEAIVFKNGEATGNLGQQTIKVKRKEEVKIKAKMNNIAYIESSEAPINVENPSKISSKDIELIINYNYVYFKITPNPSDATVIINGQTNPGTIKILAGEQITWEVSKTHYVSQSGTKTLTEDETLSVVLDKIMYSFSINPTPSDATVIINGQSIKSITVQEGTTINWSVSKTKYITQSGEAVVNKNETLNVTLEGEKVTFTINPTPSDATVTINGQTRTSITVQTGTTINWSVTKTYYQGVSETFTIEDNYTKTVTLKSNPTLPAKIEPTYYDVNGKRWENGIIPSASLITGAQTCTYHFNNIFDEFNSEAKIVSFTAKHQASGTLKPNMTSNFLVGEKIYGTCSEVLPPVATYFYLAFNDIPLMSELKTQEVKLTSTVSGSKAAGASWQLCYVEFKYINP